MRRMVNALVIVDFGNCRVVRMIAMSGLLGWVVQVGSGLVQSRVWDTSADIFTQVLPCSHAR